MRLGSDIMNNEINSLEDLYRLLLPALRSKKKEMHDLKHLYITEKDIWDYMKDNIWKDAVDLKLSDMVDNVLNIENDKIASYMAANLLESRMDYEENI